MLRRFLRGLFLMSLCFHSRILCSRLCSCFRFSTDPGVSHLSTSRVRTSSRRPQRTALRLTRVDRPCTSSQWPRATSPVQSIDCSPICWRTPSRDLGRRGVTCSCKRVLIRVVLRVILPVVLQVVVVWEIVTLYLHRVSNSRNLSRKCGNRRIK